MSRPVVSSTTPTGQLIGSDGKATFAFIKWMQSIGTTINTTFDTQGDYQGGIGDQATIVGRKTLATIVQNIDTDGVVLADGINFARNYINKDTDHIADGIGSPLAGGKVAFAALVSSTPTAGQTIRFDGANWIPVAIAESQAPVTNRWLNSYNESTGAFTASQPAFSNLSGAATPAQIPALSALSGAVTPAQVPALSALSGRIATGQLPTGLFSGTVALAKLTVSGTDGSLTLVNGSVSAYTPPT